MAKSGQSEPSRPSATQQKPHLSPKAPRRAEALLFTLLLFAYAYFCPGGGWNQNARFDQVRAIVEGGTFAINDFLVFAKASATGAKRATLERRPLPADTPVERVWTIGNTGDVTRHGDRIYPGKPPGTVLLAVPAYWVIYQVEKQLGVDPDDWWPLTVNAYLTRLLSIGAITALGGVVFLRLSQHLFPSVAMRAHLLAALSLGLATTLWPFATLFFDHNVVAVLLLAAFGLLVRACDQCAVPEVQGGMGPRNGPVERAATTVPRSGPMPPRMAWRLFAAGGLLGFATICNYLTVFPILIFSVYAVVVIRPVWRVLWLWAGGVIPAVLLAWYHLSCFGSVTTTSNTEEAAMFQDPQLFMGMFGAPDLHLVWALLFSTYRGLFVFSPILLVAFFVAGLAVAMGRRRAEVLTCLAVFAAYLVMNASFQGWGGAWTGGWSYGPRYLIPGIALLALPLCAAFDRLPRLTLAVALISFWLTLLGTAVDPQPPVDIQRPIGKYLWPLARGDAVRNGKAEITGPVSANPIGVYEGFYYRVFAAGTEQTRWNSFNLGELIWPRSRLSVLPLGGILVAAISLLWHWTKVNHRGSATPKRE